MGEELWVVDSLIVAQVSEDREEEITHHVMLNKGIESYGLKTGTFLLSQQEVLLQTCSHNPICNVHITIHTAHVNPVSLYLYRTRISSLKRYRY